MVALLFFSCSEEDKYGERVLSAILMENTDTLNVMSGQTISLSCFMSSLNADLESFDLNANFNISELGEYTASGAVSESRTYFDENNVFENKLKSIIVNYTFAVPSGLNSYSFTVRNKLGEEIETETRYVKAVAFASQGISTEMEYYTFFLYSVSTGKLYGDYDEGGNDFLDKFHKIDFYYGRDASDYSYKLYSPHAPNDLYTSYPNKAAYYNPDGTSKSTNVTTFIDVTGIDFDNITDTDFEDLDFSAGTYSKTIVDGLVFAFKTQSGDYGYLKCAFDGGYFKFLIKYKADE